MNLSRLHRFRWVLIAAGCILLILAMFSGLLGLSRSAQVSRGQVLLALCGAGIAAVGLLGRRFPRFYRLSALVLLNTLVVFLALELLSTAALRVLTTGEDPEEAQGELLWGVTDFDLPQKVYTPFVLWHSEASVEGLVAVDDSGWRVTPGASTSEGAYTVFCMGGSAMFGLCVGDSCTVPAYLQLELENLVDRPVRVVNMAQSGFVSTQNVIELIRQLQSGNRPDLVICHDGVNDVYTAWQAAEAGVHMNLHIWSELLDPAHGEPPATGQTTLSALLRATNLYRLAEQLFAGDVVPTRARVFAEPLLHGRATIDTLATAVARVYFTNYEVVDALSEQFGFDFVFFLQPVLPFCEKELTETEEEELLGMHPEGLEIFEASYGEIISSGEGRSRFHSLLGALDGLTGTCMLDPCHLNSAGNRVIAESIAIYLSEAGILPEE